MPALVVASYRDDELDRDHPLRLVLGELATASRSSRLDVAPLSPRCRRELAAPHGVDADELYRVTGGNPFFVTEALAAGRTRIPSTVRDAVLARAARLEPDSAEAPRGRRGAPPQAELWLLEALAGDGVGEPRRMPALRHARSRPDARRVPPRARPPRDRGVDAAGPERGAPPAGARRAPATRRTGSPTRGSPTTPRRPRTPSRSALRARGRRAARPPSAPTARPRRSRAALRFADGAHARAAARLLDRRASECSSPVESRRRSPRATRRWSPAGARETGGGEGQAPNALSMTALGSRSQVTDANEAAVCDASRPA